VPISPGQENPGWPHLNPEVAVRLATEARAKRLALVHFAADLYASLDQRSAIKNIGPQFSDVIIGMDDMVIKM
jgi:Metal-dependent hydrolases of the beta-lactamase superfamily III